MSTPPSLIAQVGVEGFLQCDDCLCTSAEVSYCNSCELLFCESCWDKQPQHRRRVRLGGAVHDKTDPWIASRINEIFAQSQDEVALREFHSEDEKTAWFGLHRPRNENEPLVLRDFGRYAELLATSEPTYRPTDADSVSFSNEARFPSLISFVGETGAGKSTIIKLLVESHSQGLVGLASSPVIGMVGKDIPTSDGVHLYIDPNSSQSKAPLLYADTEGLEGGERDPIASSFRMAKAQKDAQRAFPDQNRNLGQRQVLWAKSQAHLTRTFAVSNFYPRVLFTFSDVVVFVHRNSRSIEAVLKRLIGWAEAALETASNQPILPVAIVVLNASDLLATSELWDPETATKSLLTTLADTVSRNDTFAHYVKVWKTRGRVIESVQTLVSCYFSNFKVIHIPTKAQPRLMHDQVRSLYSEILWGSQAVRDHKLSLRFLLNSWELHSSLQDAFDHFSQSIDAPFDFVQTAFANRSTPATLGSNILHLATIMIKQQEKPNARGIFDKISFLVASCIMLDAVRNHIKGTADHIFPNFIVDLDTALRDFCDHVWPCQFVITSVDYSGLEMKRSDFWMPERELYRCANTRSGHSKGHQLRDGRVFEAGSYSSSFVYENYRDQFHANVYVRLQHILDRLTKLETLGETPESAALYIHRDDILKFFFKQKRAGKPESLFSSKICLSCLLGPPEHTLPCGHVLCTACCKAYGHPLRKNVIQLHECPLHDETSGLFQPWIVHLKPDAAGTRILTLDDGGVRSVLQLEILNLVEKELEGRLSVPQLFDLVIGIGTGAVIAVTIASGQWSYGSCSNLLTKLCLQAYSRNQIRSLPAIDWKRVALSRHKYHSKGLETALKTTLSENATLLDTLGSGDTAVKVAILSSVAEKTFVHANSRHSPVSKVSYHSHCPDSPTLEMKTWEAIRSSMAHTACFKPFKHRSSAQPFQVSSLTGQNLHAVAQGEMRRAYPVQPSSHPDILLSLGSGCDSEMSVESKDSSMTDFIRSKPTRSGLGNSDRACLPFLPDASHREKFIRIDPIMASMPEVDDIDCIENISVEIKSYIDMRDVRRLSLQLFANLFYFESETTGGPSKGEPCIQGNILCRFPNRTEAVSKVGKLFQRKFARATFLVRREGIVVQRISIAPGSIEKMVIMCDFHIPAFSTNVAHKSDSVNIQLLYSSGEAFSISGFPRPLDELGKPSRRQRKFWAAASSRRPDWTPPTGDRLASIDLGPLKSTSSLLLSPTFSGGRSSLSLSSDRGRSTFHELPAERGPYELAVSERSTSETQIDRKRSHSPHQEQLTSLEEALTESELYQNNLKEKIAGLQGDMRNARVSSPRSFIKDNTSVVESSVSGNLEGQDMLDINRWPTVRRIVGRK